MSDEKELKTLAVDLKKAADDVKKVAETTNTEIKNLGKVTEETKAKADEALAKHGELMARLDEVEQKMARRGQDSQDERKSVGQVVAESEGYKAFKSANGGRQRIEVKAITSVTGDVAGAAGDLLNPTRVPGIVGIPERRMTVRDLLTPGRTNQPSIEYVRETGFTNNAAIVAETAQKPESTIKFDLVTTSVVTIAHWVHASRQIMDDAPMLQSYIDGRLRYGLMYVEELQFLKGSGAGGNLTGINTVATAYAAPGGITVASETDIDTIRLAILQSELAEFPATGIVLNPIDWTRIELTKDTAGAYIFANPQAVTQPTLWGRPVVSTQAQDVDKFTVGAFRMGAQIFDRMDAEVLLSTEDRDNFIKNMVTIRAEERVGLAIYRPEAFVHGDLGNVA